MNIIALLRKQQKLIVLVAALSVIALYVLPVDQLVDAVSGNTETPPNSSNDKIKDNCDSGEGNHFGHCYRITG